MLIGTCTGLLVVSFHASIELLAFAAADRATSLPMRVMLPAMGAALAALFVYYVAPAGRGSGIVHTKAAIYVSDGRVPVGAIPGKFVACTLSIGTGTPLGPEDPSLAMGAAMASALGRVFRLSQRSMRQVTPIGAAAGIAAAFNTPITGVLFVIEEVVAAWDAAVLGSIVLSAVSAVVTTRVFLGDAPLLRLPEFTAMVDVREVAVFAILGLAAGLLATAYVRGVAAVRHRLAAARLPAGVGPLLAGAMVGCVGLWYPEVLGTGYRAMDAALHDQYPWSTLALLGLAKLLVAAAAFGAGSPGGLFAPTLFLGAMLGGTIGSLSATTLPISLTPVSSYVLVGMASIFAGVFRAPMTAIFMAFELSSTSAVIVPAMIGATVAFLTARQLHRTSLLDLVAEDEGVVLPSARSQREAEVLRIEQAMRAWDAPVFDGANAVADVRDGLERTLAPFALIRGSSGQWFGITSAAIAADAGRMERSIAEHAALDALRVAHPDEPVDVALRYLARQPVVPVVSRVDESLLRGVVTLDTVHEAYRLLEDVE
ncbi:MAG: chloride channel protein [Vicinamibacterales bacterium]